MSFGRVHRNDALLGQEEQLRYFDMKAGETNTHVTAEFATRTLSGAVPSSAQTILHSGRQTSGPYVSYNLPYGTPYLIEAGWSSSQRLLGGPPAPSGLIRSPKVRGAPTSPRAPDCVDAVPIKTSGCSNATNDVEQSDG